MDRGITVSEVYRVRQAGQADIAAVAPLFDRYRMFYGQTSDLAGAVDFLRERTARGESVILVAEMEGETQPMGFTQLYPIFSSISMRHAWILNDLFVDEAYRQRGVARNLMEAAKVYAEQSGAKGLELATARDNLSAQRLYEALGYERDDAFFHYAYTIRKS
nr:GNAT family N-acetyltransferase [Paenibacillus sp. 598K]